MCVYTFEVRELQQDGRELNQADVPEVDPEENSAEFMGILIKVHTETFLNILFNCKFEHFSYITSSFVVYAVVSEVLILSFIFRLWPS